MQEGCAPGIGSSTNLHVQYLYPPSPSRYQTVSQKENLPSVGFCVNVWYGDKPPPSRSPVQASCGSTSIVAQKMAVLQTPIFLPIERQVRVH